MTSAAPRGEGTLAPLGPAPGLDLDAAIRRMAWPAVVALLLENASELVDVAMVGRLGRLDVAAVGYAAQLVHLVATTLQAVAAAAVALAARGVGARRPEGVREALAGSMLLALIVAGIPSLVFVVAPRAVLGALDAAPEVVELAVPYLRLVVAAAFVSAVPLILESGRRAHGDTRVPLAIAAVATSVKIAGTWLLVFGNLGLPRLGLVGAATASLAAQSVATALYLVTMRDGERSGMALVPRVGGAREVVTAARDAFGIAASAIGERLAMSFALLAYFAVLSSYGPAAIAAYAIGVRVLAFSWLPSLGFGIAAATLVGQSLGRGDVPFARRAGWRSAALAVRTTLSLGLVCVLLREPLGRLFTQDAAVLRDLSPFLVALAVAQPFMGVHFTLAGALRGAGDTTTPMLGATVGNWGLRVPGAYVCARVLGWGLPWAWGALAFDHVLRATWYLVAFHRGKWAEAAVPARVAARAVAAR